MWWVTYDYYYFDLVHHLLMQTSSSYIHQMYWPLGNSKVLIYHPQGHNVSEEAHFGLIKALAALALMSNSSVLTSLGPTILLAPAMWPLTHTTLLLMGSACNLKVLVPTSCQRYAMTQGCFPSLQWRCRTRIKGNRTHPPFSRWTSMYMVWEWPWWGQRGAKSWWAVNHNLWWLDRTYLSIVISNSS